MGSTADEWDRDVCEARADAGAAGRARRGLALGGGARGHGRRGFSDEVRRGAGGHRAGLRREAAEEKETAPLVWRTTLDSIYQYYSGKFLPYHYFVHVLLIAAGAIAVGARGGSAQTTKKAIGLDCRASIGPRNGVPSLGYFCHGTELDGNITAIEMVPAIGTVKSWTERNAAAPREREGTTVRARVIMQHLVSLHRCQKSGRAR